MDRIMRPENFIGRSVSQVEEFVKDFVKPVLEENDFKHESVEINV